MLLYLQIKRHNLILRPCPIVVGVVTSALMSVGTQNEFCKSIMVFQSVGFQFLFCSLILTFLPSRQFLLLHFLIPKHQGQDKLLTLIGQTLDQMNLYTMYFITCVKYGLCIYHTKRVLFNVKGAFSSRLI